MDQLPANQRLCVETKTKSDTKKDKGKSTINAMYLLYVVH